MIYVVAAVTLKPGKKEDYLQILQDTVPEVQAEKGCVEYFPTTDHTIGWPVQSLDDNRVVILEKWKTAEDLQAHDVTPHMKKYHEKTGDLIDHVDLRVLTDL
jgi:quinol monooxygenase YgiN